MDIENQSPRSEDSDGDVIFIKQQVESNVNKEPLITSQCDILPIHDANPMEPPGVSSFVSQLSDEESQKEDKDDFRKRTIIKEEIDLVAFADVEVDIRLLMAQSRKFSPWFYLPILRTIQHLWKKLKKMKAS